MSSEAKFTNNVKECISLSREEAIRLKNDFIGPEHLFLGLIKHRSNSAIRAIEKAGVDVDDMKNYIDYNISLNTQLITDNAITGSIPLTKQCEKVLKITYLESKILRSADIGCIHLLLSILRDEDSMIVQLIKKYDITYENIRNKIDYHFSEDKSEKEESYASNSSKLDSQLEYILEKCFISIQDHFEPAIGVKDIAEEVADLIINLKTTDKGKMIGIFGNWGRGKTFLMNLIWNEIFTKNNKYKKVEFYSWKYQDTPATWAYLYEAMSTVYYESESQYRLFRFINRVKKIIKLNIIRTGWYNVLLAVLLLCTFGLITFGLIRYTPFLFDSEGATFKGFAVLGFVIPVSVALITFIKSTIQSTYSSAISLIEQYNKKKSFTSHLGVQAEVQREIKSLLKVWLKDDEKILLIVDDIDRCNEEKVIQIIDSLRIMLEDDEISKKLVVLVAIDERILNLSVKRKYYDFIDKNISMKDDFYEAKKFSDKISKEYLDKLFIAGIKLGKLSNNDIVELFKTITKGQVNDEYKIKKANIIENEYKNDDKKDNYENELIIDNEDSINLINDVKNQYILSFKEFEYISHVLENSGIEITPRQIKIFYYRYLLARNLLFRKYKHFASQLEINSVMRLLSSVLIIRCFDYSGDKIDKYTNKLENTESLIIDMDVFDEKYSLRKDLLMEVFSVSEIVVGY